MRFDYLLVKKLLNGWGGGGRGSSQIKSYEKYFLRIRISIKSKLGGGKAQNGAIDSRGRLTVESWMLKWSRKGSIDQ